MYLGIGHPAHLSDSPRATTINPKRNQNDPEMEAERTRNGTRTTAYIEFDRIVLYCIVLYCIVLYCMILYYIIL